jgi:hypothetical protein
MSIKKRNVDFDTEKKVKNIRQKNVLDKHRKLIYNIASSKSIQEDDDDALDYAYVAHTKTKRR